MDGRRRHMLDDEVEERRETVILRTFRVLGNPAVAARTVEDRKVELLVGGVERGENRSNTSLTTSTWRASGRSILLITTIGFKPTLRALPTTKLGLRHRTFCGVDEHDGGIDHRQDAFHLTAEIGVAGGIDDVDAVVLPVDRGRLGEDRDAALLSQIGGVHGALCDALVLPEGACLLQKASSTSVVLPWSTCAMIAILRRFMFSLGSCFNPPASLLVSRAAGCAGARIGFGRAGHTAYFAAAKGFLEKAEGNRKVACAFSTHRKRGNHNVFCQRDCHWPLAWARSRSPRWPIRPISTRMRVLPWRSPAWRFRKQPRLRPARAPFGPIFRRNA